LKIHRRVQVVAGRELEQAGDGGKIDVFLDRCGVERFEIPAESIILCTRLARCDKRRKPYGVLAGTQAPKDTFVESVEDQLLDLGEDFRVDRARARSDRLGVGLKLDRDVVLSR
jgi:hypothetical protein